MTIIKLNILHFKLDENKHTIAYVKKAEAAIKAIENIRHCVADNHTRAIETLKFEIQDFLKKRELNAVDFRFHYYFDNTSDGGMFWWPPNKSGSNVEVA